MVVCGCGPIFFPLPTSLIWLNKPSGGLLFSLNTTSQHPPLSATDNNLCFVRPRKCHILHKKSGYRCMTNEHYHSYTKYIKQNYVQLEFL